MRAEPRPWDSQQVAGWLEARIEAAARDQVAADRKGYEARDDYDLAAAEEWACRALMATARQGDQAALTQQFFGRIAEQLAEFGINGNYLAIRTQFYPGRGSVQRLDDCPAVRQFRAQRCIFLPVLFAKH